MTGDFSGGGRARDRLRITNREFKRISRTDQSSMLLGIRDSRFLDPLEMILFPFFFARRRRKDVFSKLVKSVEEAGLG